MSSLIHIFKLRKNQVLNILLIIYIFLDVIFLLLLCLIDWYLMASDTKALFFLITNGFYCSHSWDVFLPGCKFWTVWPFSTKMGGVMFQRICFTTASRKLGGQVGKSHPMYCPLQEEGQDELFRTENSHQVHRENTDKDLQKSNTWLDNREARGMHTCRKSSPARSDTHQSVLGQKFPHYVGNNRAGYMLITDTAQAYLKAVSQITVVYFPL